VGDRPRYARKAQNRIGDKPQELTRKQEREKERSGKNQRENAAVEFEKLRRHCLQIRDEVERSFPFPIEHDRLCEENSIAVDAEARFQARCFDFEFIPGPTKIGQPLPVRELEARADDLGHCFQPNKDLGCGSFVLKHYRCGAIVSRDLTDHRQFVGGMLPQGISLEAEQSRKRKK